LKTRTMLAAALLAVAALLALAGSASAWAPAATAPIHPGVQTFTDGAQCTANFIYSDGTTTYIGQAAHCSGTGGNTETNGCDSGTLPVGTKVDVGGASKPGTMVYNSWATMQQLGEKDANTCQYNDLALIQLDPADAANVNPSVPYWGGPTGLGGSTAQGENVYSYGNSELRGGVTTLSPETGLSLGTDSGGWNHTVYTATPGIPGDSGSGFLDKSGRGFGILSTVAIAPLAGSNGVGDLANELSYLHGHTSFTGVQLVNGTESFNGGKLPVGG
jgi:hypothetical protein